MIRRTASETGSISILVVPDASLGRERQASLLKTWALLRNLGSVTILSGKTSEDELLARLEHEQPQLILLPWHHYLAWSRIEAHYGLSRTSGPTVAGYFGAPLERHEIGDLTHYHRLILLDFATTQFVERWRIVHALVDDRRRSGVRQLVNPKSLLFFEDWKGSHPPGATLDSLIALPSLRAEPWKHRIPAIEMITLSLWNLAFEEGRALARGDWLTQLHAGRVRAYFEMTLDNELLAFRLCFQQSPNNSKEILREFWPEPSSLSLSSDFRQALIQHCDFLRIHPIAEMSEVEMVAGLLRSAPAQKRPNDLRTLWIEPLSMHLVSEIPTLRDPDRSESERELPSLSISPEDDVASSLLRAQKRILWLEQQLSERDARIEELLAGGVGSQAEKSKKKAA